MTLPDLHVPESLTQIPRYWMMWAAITLTVITALALLLSYWRGRRSRGLAPIAAGSRGEARKTIAAAGPLAALGACGMGLSLYGLYGFATDNMRLDWYFALPVMAIFDLAEITCFVSLYRSATVESGWTRSMRRTRRMAWALVAASGAMNAAHAPGNWQAMVVFAAVPAISAKLIEHELDKQMAANGGPEDEETGAGLVRLVQLSYAHAWAQVFAQFGLDPTSKGGVIQQDARIRLAARQLYKLRRALSQEESATGRRKASTQKRVQKLEAKAEMAIDVAGIAGDTPAQLTLARAMVTRGRVRDLAQMDVHDPMSIVTTLEELAIVPSAEAIEAGAKAAQAEKQRQEAEGARDQARAAEVEARAAATAVREEAAALLKAAEKAQNEAQDRVERACREADEAAERARTAKRDQEEAEVRHRELSDEIQDLTTRAGDLAVSTTATDDERQQLAQQVRDLQGEAAKTAELISTHKSQAETAREEAADAITAKEAAVNEARAAQGAATKLLEQVELRRAEVTRYVEQQRELAQQVEELTAQREKAEAATAQALDAAAKAARRAQEEEGRQRVAAVAMRHARTEMLDALTSPDPVEPPRWTSSAKMRGWELYLHKVRTDGVEPTDTELAGEDRDPSTARKWLPEFRSELARLTAAALPAQADAHDRTADQTPALV